MEDEKIVQRFCGSREEREGKKDEREEEWIDVKERETFFFIKIICWEATVLPNVLGSYSASQGSSSKIR